MESLAELIRIQLAERGRASLTVTGNSMYPMLRNCRDQVELIPVADRQKKTDIIDPAVGLIMDVRLGDAVEVGDSLATLYLNRRELANDAVAQMQKAIVISEEKPELPPLIYAAVSREGVTR